jgi:membrane-associated HD superfamily phosphohydrolase
LCISVGDAVIKSGVWDPINKFNPVTLLCLFQVGTWISNVRCCLFLCSVKMRGYCSLWWIDDHYWLNILFMIIWYFLENLIKDILNAKILPVFKTQSKLLYVHGWECLRT